jgi:hypothetical protein
VSFISLDDSGDQRMPNHVAAVELGEGDAADLG